MRNPVSRRGFLWAGGGTIATGALGLWTSAALGQNKPKKEKPPQLDRELTREFVGKAHTDLDRVKELHAEHPTLINTAWDWGGGDWETALGAASHMGRQDIANFLLDNNARLDIFAAAMLGKLEIVKAAVIAFPDTPKVLGPHRIPLIAHAKKGGEAARPVLEYLESLQITWGTQ